MHSFFTKYIHSFEPKDAIKLIHKKIEKAEELCKEHDPKYIEHLVMAWDMIQDYATAKGIDIRTLPRS